MTPRIDRYGDPIEGDDTPPQSPRRRVTVRERCDELRRIIRQAKARRNAAAPTHPDTPTTKESPE